MKITDCLRPSAVTAELPNSALQEVLAELCGPHVAGSLGSLSLLDPLLTRESQAPTGIGGGVAIPHGKGPGLQPLTTGFGRPKVGVGAIHANPTFLFFTPFAPEKPAVDDLRALAGISRLFRRFPLRESIMAAKTSSPINELVEAHDANLWGTP